MTAYSQLSNEHRRDYIQYHNVKRAERVRRKAAIVNRYKTMKGCADCGDKSLPAFCYDLDHLDPTQKVNSVGVLVNNAAPWRVIREEIQKCEVVCANCHRRRTHAH